MSLVVVRSSYVSPGLHLDVWHHDAPLQYHMASVRVLMQARGVSLDMLPMFVVTWTFALT